jgi:hypothetical protein
MPDREEDADLGGDYARDTHRGALGDDYARDGVDKARPTDEARQPARKRDEEVDIGKTRE